MKKSNTTKRALLLSALSMLLCLAMLVGSTFAWFTDTVTSGKNRIVAGNLDVELMFKNPATKTETDGWRNVENESTADPKFFVDVNGEDILWEPGVMAVTQFKVANVGSLALKYSLKTIKADHNTLDGRDLSDVIKFAVIDNEKFTAATTRADILALKPTFADFTSFTAENVLLPKDNAENKPSEKIFTVVAYWEPNVVDDNLYNVNNGKTTSDGEALYIDIELNLVATQTPHESDSFNNTYDENAWLDMKMTDNGDGTFTSEDNPESLYVKDNGTYVEVAEDTTTGLYEATDGSGDKYVANDAALTKAAETGGNVTVLNNINKTYADSNDSTNFLKATTNTNLDFGNKTIDITSASGQNGIKVNEGASATFSNGTITMDNTYGSSYPVVKAEKAEITLESMTVELTATSGNCVSAGSDGGKVIVKDSTVKGPNSTYSNALYSGSQSTLEIENTTVIGGIRVENNGNIIIKSGDFTQATFYFGGSSGNHIVYGGTFARNPKNLGLKVDANSTVTENSDGTWTVTAG